jgi:hypothetical protein
MRLLFVIPHYFHSGGQEESQPELAGKHASVTASAESRAKAVSKTVMSLHQTFGSSQAMIRLADRRTIAANEAVRHEVHVVIVTTGNQHLVSSMTAPSNLYHHASMDGDPTRLGFDCHNILRDRWGNYDFYSFLEDDLSISDGWFFEKLRWFNSHVGNKNLLMPNRFEKAEGLAYNKCYLDGDLAASVTAPFQDVSQTPELKSTVMGKSIRFVRPLNPHSGCFFLNSAQMKTWMQQPHFGSRAPSFIGPLESAATLGVMRTFRIYKPAPENANFLEVEHDDCRFIRLIRFGNGE